MLILQNTRQLRNSLFFFSLLCAVMILSSPADAQYNPKYSSIVIDAHSGAIISQKYPDKILHPASLTKMMTLYLAFDAIKQRKLSMNSRLWVSGYASNMVPSKLGLKKGETIKLKHAILSLVTKSANDVAVAIAESIAGSESQFAVLMNRKAAELGMSRTNFTNASGLHDPRQVSTARDMARLSRALMMYHPEFYDYFSTRSFTYQGRTYRNHNRLMSSYKGMDGLKTGYVRAAGFNLAASANRGGRRLIGVVFGGRSTRSRNRHMQLLLDRGFQEATDMKIAALVREQKPLPRPRPFAGYQIAALDTNMNPPTSDEYDESYYDMMVGEGDIDPEATREMAERITPAARSRQGNWSIQVGAFSTQNKTNQVLQDSINSLPRLLGQAEPQIVPLRAGRKTIYRARIAGLDETTAAEACARLPDCLRLAPVSTR